MAQQRPRTRPNRLGQRPPLRPSHRSRSSHRNLNLLRRRLRTHRKHVAGLRLSGAEWSSRRQPQPQHHLLLRRSLLLPQRQQQHRLRLHTRRLRTSSARSSCSCCSCWSGHWIRTRRSGCSVRHQATTPLCARHASLCLSCLAAPGFQAPASPWRGAQSDSSRSISSFCTQTIGGWMNMPACCLARMN